jgi:hypothetical protein
MGNDRAMVLVRACRDWQARTRGVQVWIMPLRQALTAHVRCEASGLASLWEDAGPEARCASISIERRGAQRYRKAFDRWRGQIASLAGKALSNFAADFGVASAAGRFR